MDLLLGTALSIRARERVGGQGWWRSGVRGCGFGEVVELACRFVGQPSWWSCRATFRVAGFNALTAGSHGGNSICVTTGVRGKPATSQI